MVLKMSDTPLRYKISDWHQLPECKSNNSRSLQLHVADLIQDDRISGLRITLTHESFGVLFAYVLNLSGRIVTIPESEVVPQLTPAEILRELEKFGYLISYEPSKNLKESQLAFLKALLGLHYDKIRILNVYTIEGGVRRFTWYVVAFNVSKNPYWLNNDYSPSYAEFTKSVLEGSAYNVSALPECSRYDWSWLKGWVGSIEDILAENKASTD